MIPVAEPNLAGKETEYATEAIASGWVSGGGPFVERFEAMVADAVGKSWCVATLSGTAALHVALAAKGVGPGSLVDVRSFTFIAAANVLSYLGAEPHFVDIHFAWSPDNSWVGSVLDAAAAITAQNLYGELICYSFNGNKTITTGQGGAVVGDDPVLEEKVRHLATTAKIGDGYRHDEVGFNYAMPNVTAAIGCAQMERLEEFRDSKRMIMRRYQDAGIALIESRWMALWRTLNRDVKIEVLREAGIAARPFWTPLHMQDPYMNYACGDLPNTEEIWDKLVCLPCATTLTTADQDKVIKVCEGFLR